MGKRSAGVRGVVAVLALVAALGFATGTASAADGSVGVCVSAGAGGANIEACIDKDGVTISKSDGAGVSVGTSTTRGWDGSKTTCVIVSGSAGDVVMGSVSAGICRDDGGKPYPVAGAGIGLGVGTKGMGVGITVEGSQRINPTTIAPIRGSTNSTRTDLGPKWKP